MLPRHCILQKNFMSHPVEASLSLSVCVSLSLYRDKISFVGVAHLTRGGAQSCSWALYRCNLLRHLSFSECTYLSLCMCVSLPLSLKIYRPLSFVNLLPVSLDDTSP